MARRIAVRHPDGEYEIRIEEGALERLSARLSWFFRVGRIAVVADETVAGLYARHLEAFPPDARFVLPTGEASKNLDSVRALYDGFVSAGLDRHSTVVAFGGGVVGDTAGFAAATYLRGIRLVQIPTTLLAMVDASVGGKVAVDLPQGKNLVGAFHQPELVLIDPAVLSTLPSNHWKCGMAEVIKHGLLADAALLNPKLWVQERRAELVSRAVRVKARIVEADPFEQDRRAHLNLGHTFGHAIEKVTSYRCPHGEAVAVGLVAAAVLSRQMGLCTGRLPSLVRRTLAKAGLPCRIDGLDAAEVRAAMSVDKKRIQGRNRFVLLADVGRPMLVDDVPENLILRSLAEIGAEAQSRPR